MPSYSPPRRKANSGSGVFVTVTMGGGVATHSLPVTCGARRHHFRNSTVTAVACCLLVLAGCFGVMYRHLSVFERAAEARRQSILHQPPTTAQRANEHPAQLRRSNALARHAHSDAGGHVQLAGLEARGQNEVASRDSRTEQVQPEAAQREAAQQGAAPLQLPAEPPLNQQELHGGWNLTWEVYDRATKHPNATVVSWSQPRVLLIHDFLSPEEVEHMVHKAEGGFARSEVVSDDNSLSSVRTSSGAWLSGARRDDKVTEIEHRIHSLVGIPHAFGESLYVLQYNLGQKYEVHCDHCTSVRGQPTSASCKDFLHRAGGPGCGPGAGGVTCGDRLATVILYLKSPNKGGATVFPRAKHYRMPELPAREQAAQQAQHAQQGGGKIAVGAAGGDAIKRQLGEQEAQLDAALGLATEQPAGADVPSYCREGAGTLQVAPPPGSAVLFWDYVPGGASWHDGDLASPDPSSEHGGCPVLEGQKMIASRWIRGTPFA